MADGSSYEIKLLVNSVGAETAADQLNTIAGKLDAAAAVSSSFDTAIDRTRTLLADAGAAASQAAARLAETSAGYAQAERAATKAAQAVERATLKGDTGKLPELQAAALAASAAVQEQAKALDEARAAATTAEAAEKKLAATLKTLEAAAKSEAAAQEAASKKAEAAATQAAKQEGKLDETTKKALGPMGEKLDKLGAMRKLLGESGWAGAAIVATLAIYALSAAVILGVFALAKMAVELNKGAMEKLAKTSKLAKEDLARLFEGVHVEKFTDALAKVETMLGQNTSTGRALKQLLSTILNPLFDAIPKILPYVQAFLTGMVLGALQVAIAFVKAYIAIKAVIPPSVIADIQAMTGGLLTLKNAMIAGQVALAILGVALAICTAFMFALAVAFVITNIPLALLIAGLLILAAIMFAPVIAIILLIAYFDEIMGWFGRLGQGALAAGKGIIDGLVNSISSGAGIVFDALRNLGTGAMGALKSALGIASPSRFAAEYAANVTTTFSDTTEEGAPDAHAALASLAEPPDMPRRDPAQRAGSSAASVTHGGDTYHVTINAPTGDAQDIRAAFEAWYNALIEGDAQQLAGAT